MPETRDLGPLDFSRRVSVETPEHVTLRLELAGIGSRAAAAVYDAVVLSVLLFVVVMGIGVAGTAVAADTTEALFWVGALVILTLFVITWGYFALFEALGAGRTPGKKRLGIRVVMDTGHPITFQAAMVRNLVRLVDLQPGFSYVVGLLFLYFHPQHKRLGDIVAGTVVVRDRPLEVAAPAEPATAAAAEPLDAGPPRLVDDEFRLLEQLVGRLDELSPAARARLVSSLAARFADRFPQRDPRPETFLVALYHEELARRRAKTATRRAAGGGAALAAGTAERFAALRRAGWERFRAQATEAERRGLKRLSGDEVVRFAAQYRAVAADLARARTYGADHRTLQYLERVVGAGHNALYGLRGVRRLPLKRLLLEELPAAAWRARAFALVAALLFILPGVAGYAVIRERPEVAQDVIPDGMIARAESGDYEREAGRGYAEAPSPFLPIVASSIITNNVQVAFGAFAFGVTAGIGTVFLLVFNGLFFGAVLGLFANYGLLDWILTFVAGHGVLELTAIFFAGAAGLLVARAIVAPGDLARRDALVVYGREAIRLVGVATCLLILAGIIEGFLSASAAPAALKLGVSAASAVLVWLYLLAGRRAASTTLGVPESPLVSAPTAAPR